MALMMRSPMWLWSPMRHTQEKAMEQGNTGLTAKIDKSSWLHVRSATCFTGKRGRQDGCGYEIKWNKKKKRRQGRAQKEDKGEIKTQKIIKRAGGRGRVV